MSLADFEARYRADPDPWRYETSAYERDKYAATLAACGSGPFAQALELGASIGVFTAMLAPRCRRLITLDAAPTAVAMARRRLAGCDGLEIRLGAIPQQLPDGRFDLVVASEILYYLSAPALGGVFAHLARVLAPGGRLVAVHWRPAGPDRPLDADAVHAALLRRPWLRSLAVGDTDDYRLDVLERR